MSQATDQHGERAKDDHPLEIVLRLIAQAAPGPWHPYRVPGLDRQILDEVLEELYLQGLIRKGPATLEGPSVELTPQGQRVLEDEEMLARLREDRAIDPNRPADVIRANLRNPPDVWACKAIIFANVAVFLWGLLLAWRAGIAQSFFWFPRVVDIPILNGILHTTGSLSATDLRNGEWWRLITSGFNHGGVLHLAVNMYSLNSVGSFIEQRWGWWRFLFIYFISIWTGSCLAMAYQPDRAVVGASGGVFGVFGGVIAWLLLYGKFLPAHARQSAWQNVMINILLLGVMSWMLRNYLSHWGHAGGAIGGFVTTFVLHLQRFGPGVLRIAGTLALFPLPFLGYAWMHHVWKEKPPKGLVADKREKEEKENPDKQGRKRKKKPDEPEGWAAGPFYRHHAEPVSEACAALETICARMPVAEKDIKNDKAAVKRTLDAISAQQKVLVEQQADLKQARYDKEGLEKARRKTLDLVAEFIELGDRAQRHLKQPTGATRSKLQEQFDKAGDLLHDFRKELKALRGR
jgi:membrane associated rhomboid family serine protease